MKDLIFFVLGAISYAIASEGMDLAHVKTWSKEFWMIFLGIGLSWTFIGLGLQGV